MTEHMKHKIITQEDVARQAGVSRSIVSYVINNGPRKVSEETRNRVLEAIRELDYRPNKHAQLLSSTDEALAEKYIGIVLEVDYMFKRPYYCSILASIHERAHQLGWHIRFIRVFDDFDNPALFNELIHPNEISGVILLGLGQLVSQSSHNAELVQAIIKRVERVVCIEWEWPGVPLIQFDRQNAAYQATSHLLDLGHERIVYIGPQDKRITGYQQALWERNVSPAYHRMYDASDAQSGYDRCQELFQSGAFSAIFAGTDEVSIGILKCLHEHYLVVPDDVAIASIDNIDMSRFTIPALTTVDVPKEQIGFHAVDTLISDQPWNGAAAFAINVPTELIVRESSFRQVE